ncbi:recombinase RecX [Rhodospirillum rubrum]|uniref:regulatory protein RecX n=1 Tax=Rhodospirillum rubrum TaxID=1085 RepID=UPI001902E8BE|nr:regulatory protein RecX [Rhodospirillum rubrum]MBK1666272.1 recombinase RecX [Rhodospirillum rubrum]MBK1678466.1 recombinase RecX [Rhodospirillum rubrum]
MATDYSQGRPVAKPVTPARLERIALFYLERFPASTEGLRRVLMRRVERSVRAHDTDRAQAATWVEAVLTRLKASGLLDDRVFAEGKARALFRRGDPPGLIRRALTARGVGAEAIDAALAEVLEHSEDPDHEAALAYCRRRRLGPFRLDRASRPANHRKDLAALARHGFSRAVALRVLSLDEDGSEGGLTITPSFWA